MKLSSSLKNECSFKLLSAKNLHSSVISYVPKFFLLHIHSLWSRIYTSNEHSYAYMFNEGTYNCMHVVVCVLIDGPKTRFHSTSISPTYDRLTYIIRERKKCLFVR